MIGKNTSNVPRKFLLAFLCVGVALAEPPLTARAEQPAPLILPKTSEEIPGRRIGWNFNNVREVLTKADSDGKPIVAVIIANRCGWCRIYLAHVLRCDALNAFSGQAHFVILYATQVSLDNKNTPPKDRDIKQFTDLLKIDGYPTTSIVNVKNKAITPMIKVSGAVSEAELSGILTKLGLKPEAGAPRLGQSASIGLPKPAACGLNERAEALAASAPSEVQWGISP